VKTPKPTQPLGQGKALHRFRRREAPADDGSQPGTPPSRKTGACGQRCMYRPFGRVSARLILAGRGAPPGRFNRWEPAANHLVVGTDHPLERGPRTLELSHRNYFSAACGVPLTACLCQRLCIDGEAKAPRGAAASTAQAPSPGGVNPRCRLLEGDSERAAKSRALPRAERTEQAEVNKQIRLCLIISKERVQDSTCNRHLTITSGDRRQHWELSSWTIGILPASPTPERTETD